VPLARAHSGRAAVSEHRERHRECRRGVDSRVRRGLATRAGDEHLGIRCSSGPKRRSPALNPSQFLRKRLRPNTRTLWNRVVPPAPRRLSQRDLFGMTSVQVCRHASERLSSTLDRGELVVRHRLRDAANQGLRTCKIHRSSAGISRPRTCTCGSAIHVSAAD